MPQFPIPPGKKAGEVVPLSPQDSRHISQVLRHKKGDSLFVFDGQNRFRSEIAQLAPKEVRVKILERLAAPRIEGELVLCQALLKKDKMEFLVQKAVEIGVSRFCPIKTGRSIPRGEQTARIDRWQRIADEALKQCGRTERMTVHPVVEFQERLKLMEPDATRILLDDRGEKIASLSLSDRVILLIGPEGGFTKSEVEKAGERNCLIASLGSLTLRAETASIAAMTLIQHGLGNL